MIIISISDVESSRGVGASNEEGSESVRLSTGAAVGIGVTLTLLVALSVGVVIGVCVSWCVWKSNCAQQQVREQQLPGANADYEEPIPTEIMDTDIPLSDNQAYTLVNIQS